MARRTTSPERAPLGVGVAGVGEVLRAGHQPDELGRLDLAPGARGDRLARAHHRHPVADLLDLVHPVRDEDRARPLAREAADDREQPVAGRDVERRGRLVEHEDPRTPDERAGDAARLAVAERELLDGTAAGRSRRPSARAASRTRARGALPSRRASRWSGSMPSQRLSRIERGGTTSTSWKTATIPRSSASRGDRTAVSVRAAHLDRPAVGPVDAREHLDERALPRPVLAHDRVHLADPQVERARLDSLRRAERLREIRRPQGERRAGLGNGGRGLECSRDVATSASWPRPRGARPRAAAR